MRRPVQADPEDPDRDEFWWVEWCEGMPLEPARIAFREGVATGVTMLGSDYEEELAGRGVRLVERVAPPSSATA